jgi:uncharacterized membrane protein
LGGKNAAGTFTGGGARIGGAAATVADELGAVSVTVCGAGELHAKKPNVTQKHLAITISSLIVLRKERRDHSRRRGVLIAPIRVMAEQLDTIAALHERAQKRVGSHQRLMETVTAQVGRPRTIYVLVILTFGWMAINLAMRKPIDPAPFPWLQGAFCVYAAIVATIVVTTQNRQQRHTEERAYLDLQINIIAEQKTAKLIELIEELRRDMPQVRDRRDPEAENMAHAVDTELVLTALEDAEKKT